LAAAHPGKRATAARPGALDEVARQRRSSGGSARLVVDDLDRGTAAAEHDDGAERRIVGEAEDQLARLRPQHHRLHGDAGNPRLRTKLLRPRQDIGGRGAHGVGASEIEHTPPTSDLWMMSRDMTFSTTVAPCANSAEA